MSAVDQSGLSELSPVIVIATREPQDELYLRQKIEHHEMHVVDADGCRAALAAAGQTGATAVLCDETLPWRDLLSYFAQDCSPPLLIVMAASPTADLIAEVFRLGGFEVLSKPFNGVEVERVLCSIAVPRLAFAHGV